ncbi:regulatory particle non-ATPase [Xylographa trunciseda]|nr:regulatory particle non-ATPase [Xylographa trunciseda]
MHYFRYGLSWPFNFFSTLISALGLAAFGKPRQARKSSPDEPQSKCASNDFHERTKNPAEIPCRIITMTSESDLSHILAQLSSLPPNSTQTASLLSKAKLTLLHLDALIPGPSTPASLLLLARRVLETGALISIRNQNPDAFTRYYQQLQPFYDLPPSSYSSSSAKPSEEEAVGQRSKVTGLYLLLLLTKGDYAGFHTLLEGLEVQATGEGLEGDVFIRYPVMLEQWLMEGAYDRVWGAMKGKGVPSEEFAVFSEVLVVTIRSEIASCSEKAYPSLPIPNAKNLLFLDSEGSVVAFAQERGWVVKDGRIYFPLQQGQDVRSEKEILVASGQVIENTIGYARELETIV